jgi:hypothetical protein
MTSRLGVLRFMMILIGVFAALASVLATVGVYGVMSHAVSHGLWRATPGYVAVGDRARNETGRGRRGHRIIGGARIDGEVLYRHRGLRAFKKAQTNK